MPPLILVPPYISNKNNVQQFIIAAVNLYSNGTQSIHTASASNITVADTNASPISASANTGQIRASTFYGNYVGPSIIIPCFASEVTAILNAITNVKAQSNSYGGPGASASSPYFNAMGQQRRMIAQLFFYEISLTYYWAAQISY